MVRKQNTTKGKKLPKVVEEEKIDEEISDNASEQDNDDDESQLEDDSNIPEEKRFAKHHDEASLEIILKENPLVLIDFYTDWCVPCKLQSRLLEQYKDDLLKDYPDIKVCKLNLETSRNLGKAFQIKYVPNLVLYYKGRFYVYEAGIKTTNEIKDYIKLLVEKVEEEIKNGGDENTLFK